MWYSYTRCAQRLLWLLKDLDAHGHVSRCLSRQHCWKYIATQEFPPPTGVFLSIEVEAQTGEGTASRQLSGIVDFCSIKSEDGGKGCDGASLFQGCEQNRRCITNANGCSGPLPAGVKNNPTQGTLGLTSTAFGQPEDPDSPEGAPTVFGQRRPIQLPCNRHDECYHKRCPQEHTRRGGVTDKLDCNQRFFDDMNAVCRRAYPESTCPVARVGPLKCPKWRVEKNACYGWARVYFDAVNFDSLRFIGLPPHEDPQTLSWCIGCPTIP